MNPSTPDTCPGGNATSSAAVPRKYPSATTAPPISNASGIVRRGCSISSAINDPVSMPLNPKQIVDQKIASFNENRGVIDSNEKCVADPNRRADTSASRIRIAIGTQLPSEQILLSHFPAFSPAMFTTVITASHSTANAMKYPGLAANLCPHTPPAKSSEPAPKYSTEAKKGRFDIQYIHDVRNPAKSPNDSRVHTYSPPSRG